MIDNICKHYDFNIYIMYKFKGIFPSKCIKNNNRFRSDTFVGFSSFIIVLIKPLIHRPVYSVVSFTRSLHI